MKRRSMRSSILTSCAALVASAFLSAIPAFATCGPGVYFTAPPTVPGTLPSFADRYASLRALDKFYQDDTMVPRWKQLIADIKAAGSPAPDLLARSYMMLAASLTEDDQVADGFAAAQEAERITQAAGLGDKPFRVELLSVLAAKETNAGHAEIALTHAQSAMTRAQQLFGTESWEYGAAATSVGAAHYALGQFGAAEEAIATSETLALKCLDPRDPRLVGRISSHGAMLGMIGKLDESLIENERAASWAVTNLAEDSARVPFVLDNFGLALRNASRLGEAEVILRRAVDLQARYHSADPLGLSNSLAKLANVLEAQGHHAEAEALWMKSEELFLKSHDRSNPIAGGGAYRRAADAAQARGDLALALTRRVAAIAIMAKDAPPTHPELARAHIEYAATLLLAGEPAKALAEAEPAIVLVRKGLGEADPKRMSAEIIYARIVAATAPPGAAPEAGAEAGYAIAAPVAKRLETLLLDSATARGDLVVYAPLFSTSFATVTEFALATHRDEEAFHALQLANLSEIVLVNADIAVRAAANNPTSSALISRLQNAVERRKLLDRERSFATSKHQAEALVQLEAKIKANDAAIATTSTDLDRAFPAFRRLARPVPITLAAYRRTLSPDQVLVAPLTVDNGTITVAVTQHAFAWSKTAFSRATVGALVERIRKSIGDLSNNPARPFDTAAARQLYRAIVPPPVARTLIGHPRLLYYAPGALATIPPSLLVSAAPRRGVPTAWLIRSHSITVLPTLANSNGAPTGANKDHSFFGIGAPVFKDAQTRAPGSLLIPVDRSARFGALPFAGRELRALAALVGGKDELILTGEAATEAAFKSTDLRRFHIIAVATHGVLNDALPGLTEPALMMTPPPIVHDTDDGLMTASEVASLNLDADWVILSACDSASGSGEGSATYSGLASAFMYAGARALLVSHWRVRDDAAAFLTVETLRAVARGTDRSTALQHAMLKLMAKRSIAQSGNPAIWAPFVLIDR